MITGFNTDIEHEGVTYHVQTEDKGLETPLLLSLVYSGGAILASKRSSYQDLIAKGFDEAVLAERLQRQHRLICAAINAGRIDDLKKMSGPGRTGSLTAPEAFVPPTVDDRPLAPQPLDPGELTPQPIEPIPPERTREQESLQNTRPGTANQGADRVQPPGTPSAYTVYDSRRRSGESESSQFEESLRITLRGEKNFRGGDHVELELFVTQGTAHGHVAVPASVSVKVLGSAFRPVILSLKTNRQGMVTVKTRIPSFSTGRAAIVIKATAAVGSVETRRVIHPG